MTHLVTKSYPLETKCEKSCASDYVNNLMDEEKVNLSACMLRQSAQTVRSSYLARPDSIGAAVRL